MARTAVKIAISLPKARVEHLRAIQARERKSLSAVVDQRPNAEVGSSQTQKWGQVLKVVRYGLDDPCHPPVPLPLISSDE